MCQKISNSPHKATDATTNTATTINMKLFIISLVISSVHGFGMPVLPAEMNIAVDKLVRYVPLSNDPIEVIAKTALVPMIIYSPFAMRDSKKEVQLPRPGSYDSEIDYDAPIDRQLKTGHIIRRQPYTLGLGSMGSITLPSTIQNAMHLYEPEIKFQLTEDIEEQWFSLIHDECYLGKDLTAHECVDFDPLHNTKMA